MKTFSSLLAVALMSPIPVYAESLWTFITDSSDRTLYFGRNIREYEGITFAEIKTEDDPKGDNGDNHSWNQAFNCKNKTWRQKGKGFVPVKEGKVAYEWFKYACNK